MVQSIYRTGLIGSELVILLNIVLFTVKSRDDGDDFKLGPKRNEMKTEMEHVIEHSCTSVYCSLPGSW